ncbi:MAG: RNA polymerase sigma factor SigX [Peptococcaceae bacterium]|nr:RNA polymerase sigma factor SigX [Peptococcaceae bacterium]
MNIRDLFHRFYPAVCRQLTCILGDSGLAEDVAQEAFIRLCQSPPSNPDRVRGWLFRVATNLAYNHLRSEKSRSRREFSVQSGCSAEASSEEIVIRREEAEMVHRVLKSLGERDRTCLIMKFSGFSYEEIAQAIGVRKASVGTVIARAQARFRDKILEMKGSDSNVL